MPPSPPELVHSIAAAQPGALPIPVDRRPSLNQRLSHRIVASPAHQGSSSMAPHTEISSIAAREVLDSRGLPTIEVDVLLSGGASGRASAPSGVRAGGEQTAAELRDGDPAYYLGQGVLSAVDNVESILAPELQGFDATNQRLLDATMIGLDGTENKARLGANTILAVSMAAARASAAALGIPLYRYLGGSNSSLLPTPHIGVLRAPHPARTGARPIDLLVVPVSAETFSDALRQGMEVFYTVQSMLDHPQQGIGAQGLLESGPGSLTQAIEFLLAAITKLGLRPGDDVALALDAAGSAPSRAATAENNSPDAGRSEQDAHAQADRWISLVEQYPIVSLEDAIAPDDHEGWRYLTERLGSRVQLTGGELFATATDRLRQGIEQKLGNSIGISLREAGTVSEAVETVELARRFGYTTVLTGEPGETEDTFVADLAVGSGAGQMKAGAPSSTGFIARYNQLLRIEEQLGQAAQYLGLGAALHRG